MKISVYILLLISILFSGSFTAQSEDPVVVDKEIKKIRFGLKGFSSIGWLTPENELSLTRGKIGIGFGWGLNTELYINNTTSFRTGFSLSTFSGGLNYNDNSKTLNEETYKSTYYVVDGGEFQEWENDSIVPSGEMFKLNSRKFDLRYINIPLILKLKTKEIGYMTYFGEFGGVLGFKTKASSEDTQINVSLDTLNNKYVTQGNPSVPTNDFNINDVSHPIRAGLCLGAGAEYNFSGSTAIFFQLNWNYFMTSMLKKQDKDNYLRSFKPSEDPGISGKFEAVNSKSIPGSFHLTVGILF